MQSVVVRGAAQGGRRPTVVLVHGGSWRMPYGRWLMWPIAYDLRRRGYVTANVGYRRLGRFGGGGGWPATFDDARAAIEAVASDARGIDTDRIVLVGHSAGGHLAMWAAGERPDLCAGVVSMAGPVDLEPSWTSGDPSVVALLEDVPESDRFSATSPIERLPSGVRTACVHGSDDTTVRPAVSQRFVRAAADAGDPSELHLIDGEGHRAPLSTRSQMWQRVVEVVDEMVGP